MYIEFITNGNKTIANRASMALMLWLYGNMPQWSLPENAKPLTIYQTGPSLDGPYDKLFFVNVVAAIERKYGSGPDVAYYSDDFYNKYKDINFKDIPENTETLKYEDDAVKILKWLSEKGDILELEII